MCQEYNDLVFRPESKGELSLPFKGSKKRIHDFNLTLFKGQQPHCNPLWHILLDKSSENEWGEYTNTVSYLVLAYLYVTCCRSKCEVINAHKIRPCEIKNHPILSANANMSNERYEPWYHRQGGPYNTSGKPCPSRIDLHTFMRTFPNHHMVFRVWV